MSARIVNGWLCAFIALMACQARAVAPERPNIVFILADDLGYSDLGCYGSGYYETPHVDKLAAGGVRFTDAYNCGPNCQPTRAALMSGQYSPRTGVYTVGKIDRFNWQSRPLRPVDNVTALPRETTTIAQALQQAGYATGMFGKWHLGNREEHHPSRRGFDEAVVSAGRHYGFRTHPAVEHAPDAYLADFLTDRAVDFIQRHQDEPFFLYLPHFGVHAPHDAKPELIDHFKSKPAAGGHRDPTYAAMIASVDESVGRVAAKLHELGLAERTLVVFTSDNGGVGGHRSIGLSKEGITDNAPLKGGKGSLYEGGIRVPYVFSWPGTIDGGSTEGTPIHAVDLFPSLLELAGAAPPQDQPLDGVSYVSLLTGAQASLPRSALYWHFPGYLGAGPGQWRTTPVSVVRSGEWKLLEFLEDGHSELYNLAADVGERDNLAEKEPEQTAELRRLLGDWRQQIGARMPSPNQRREDSPRRGARRSGNARAADRAASDGSTTP